MAMVSVGTKAINYTYTDRDDNTATLTLYAPNDVITEDVETWAIGPGLTLAQGISNATITGLSITQNYEENAPAIAVEASDVERKALFSFKVDGGGTSSFRIPSVRNELVVDGTNVLNQADASVSGFIAAMTDTGLFDLFGMGNFRGDKLTALASVPRKVHKNSTKG